VLAEFIKSLPTIGTKDRLPYVDYKCQCGSVWASFESVHMWPYFEHVRICGVCGVRRVAHVRVDWTKEHV